MYNTALQINNPDGGDVNITSNTGQVKINGVVPSGGGGIVDPLNIGTLNADTLVTTPLIQPPDIGTPLFIEANVIRAPTAGPAGLELVDVTSVTATGTISANSIFSTTSVSTDSLSTNTGDITLNGAGNVRVLGTGKLISGVNGIDSNGDLNTIGNNDIISGRDIYFDGNDIYKRQNNPVDNISYKDFKQLPGKNDNNVFTGSNQFNSNVTEFSEKVSVGERDGGGLFTQKIALNKSGNIECQTIQNVTSITTGTITCDNGPLNECKARVFNTRTSGTNGWNIKQALEEADPPGNQANNILQIAATQAQVAGQPVEIYVTSSEFDPSNGDNPNIKLIPDTVLNGGSVQASQYDLGTASDRYYLKQDIGGPNDQVLQIRAPTVGASVNFKDSLNADVLVVKATELDLKNSIPINFGGYSFRPQQYSLNKTITIAAQKDSATFTNMIFNPRDVGATWTNVNTGAINQSLYNDALVGYYKCTVTQTALSSSGNFERIYIIFDYPLVFSQQTSPDIFPPISYGYKIKPNNALPEIEIDHTNTPVQSQPVFLKFPNQSSGETMAINVKLTKMDY